ncbi:MAG TPA: efflux RND transporter periplasmic adaptor subunit, partial [Sphingomonas sp.]
MTEAEMHTPSPAPRHHRGRQIAIALGGGALLAIIIALSNHHGGSNAPKADAPVPVSVASAAIRDLPLWKSGVGSVQPIEVVDVKPRVDGQIVRILFNEGDMVAQDQPLARIDPRAYKAAYDQAVANRNRDAAQLANTRLDLDRAVKLAALGAGTSQNVDTLKAQAAAQAAGVAADQAQIDTTRLNLDWTTIRSPIAGRVGLR